MLNAMRRIGGSEKRQIAFARKHALECGGLTPFFERTNRTCKNQTPTDTLGMFKFTDSIFINSSAP
jgi:hypothetical protein